MTKSFFFYGVYDGDKGEDTWKALHEYFEKLARENDDAVTEATITDRKAKSKR